MNAQLARINALKTTLDQHRPLDPAIVANLREDLILRWTYHSNTIEGNTLIVKDSFQPYWHSLEIHPPEAYPS
jgi:hypothetical protein